jgi:hypothetical protein
LGTALDDAQETPQRQIRAVYGDATIRVYQAYPDEIAVAALAKGSFVSPPFKMERMTWIKSLFLWMRYRVGWGFKDAEAWRACVTTYRCDCRPVYSRNF